MNQQFDQLEIKIAYLEQANAELGEEMFRQRQEMKVLREQLAALTGRFEAAQDLATDFTPDDEKPPHY